MYIFCEFEIINHPNIYDFYITWNLAEFMLSPPDFLSLLYIAHSSSDYVKNQAYPNHNDWLSFSYISWCFIFFDVNQTR